MIRFESVTKKFPDGTEALKDITLTIPRHKLTAIIGPSGCGKTTLMRMINRLEVPTDGEIFIDNNPVSSRDEVELRRSIGYVIQRIGLIPHMTIEENIALVPDLLGWDKKRKMERVDELLKMVDLEPSIFKKRYPIELSGGQQQRVGVGRALASNPEIILMDEPFSALDPISREQLQEELKNLQQKIRKTIVFVTHDMDEALDIADEIIIMRKGKVEQMATPAELIETQENEFVSNFIGAERIARYRDVGQMTLKEFSAYFQKDYDGSAVSVDHTTTLREAIALLDGNDGSRLRVNEDNQVLGYIGYDSIAKAFMAHAGRGV